MGIIGKTLVAILLIGVAIAAAGIYRFNFTNDDLYLELEDGRVIPLDQASDADKGSSGALINTNQTAQASASVNDQQTSVVASTSGDGVNKVMLKLFSLQTTNAFPILLPQTSLSVPLSEFVSAGDVEYAAAEYQDGEAQGRVMLDYLNITPINFDQQGLDASAVTEAVTESQSMPFIAPFAVTTQGSGSFWYVGMFSLNYQNDTVAHLGSVFIGDRVVIDSIEAATPFSAPYQMLVHYRDHTEAQSMAEPPATEHVLTLTVSESGIVLPLAP